MDMFVVRGGRPLAGRVRVSGAKNAALPLLAATILSDGVSVLHDVPDLVDVRSMERLLASLGVSVERNDSGTTQVGVVDEAPCIADYELVRRMRASICVLGPLVARRGRAVVSLPGGCNIGTRPIDLHLAGLRALGAEVETRNGYVVARADRLVGARVDLAGPNGTTVTGTANVLCAATLAEGRTTITSAAREPEIVDLGRFLVGLGARVEGLGTSELTVDGVERLGGTEHVLVPDRIEAATLMIAAAITRGRVELDNVELEHLGSVVEVLRSTGVVVRESDDAIVVDGTGTLRAVDCVARPFPGVPTDVQAQLTALLATVPGQAVVRDDVFPERFMHAAELLRLGADVRAGTGSVTVRGVSRLTGANVMASDLRASAALVLAGLAAEGETTVRRIYHLDRGYEGLEVKLRALGADVERVVDVPAAVPGELVPGERRQAG